jgi:hypothetical protein
MTDGAISAPNHDPIVHPPTAMKIKAMTFNAICMSIARTSVHTHGPIAMIQGIGPARLPGIAVSARKRLMCAASESGGRKNESNQNKLHQVFFLVWVGTKGHGGHFIDLASYLSERSGERPWVV